MQRSNDKFRFYVLKQIVLCDGMFFGTKLFDLYD